MKQLLIISGKGGTGKTTVASALIALSNAKAYADCDVDAPNLHLIMSNTKQPQKSDYHGMPKAQINQSACAQCGLCIQHCRFDAIVNDNGYRINPHACEGCGVCEFLCPQGAISLKPTIAGELMLYLDDAVFSTAQLKMGSGTSGKLVTEVKKQLKSVVIEADLAIIDGSPGIGCPVIASLSGVDMALIVAEPTISGISDMERIIKTAEVFQTVIAVCINKFDINLENSRKIESFCQNHRLPLVGKIPFDSSAVKAINLGQSIVEFDCPAGRAMVEVFTKIDRLLFS